MNKTIWMYWEDPKHGVKPPYIDLCMETIERNKGDYKIVIVTPNNVRDFLPDITPRVFKIKKIAHRADYIRGHLLLKYGGVWLDSDVILLKTLNLDDCFKDHDFVGYGKDIGEPSINFFGAKAGCPLVEKWVSGMDKKMKSFIPKYKFKWTELGYSILWTYSKSYDYYHIDYNLIAPVAWQDWELFFDNKTKLNNIITNKTISMMLFNKNMFQKLERISKKEILSADNLLGEVFRYALKEV